MLLPVSASWTIRIVQPTIATRPFQFCSKAWCQQQICVVLQACLKPSKAVMPAEHATLSVCLSCRSLKLQAHLGLGRENAVLKRLLPGETLQTDSTQASCMISRT